ncbi:RAMP superfamily CRISPR-associated protein [Scytonema sp. PRP1]|uniref:RAMP superfamily CRISPR-associated protein n=1 Tax=Scytonema sp. PRP1 TaxID=3120513 RepID=UPI002FD5A115
MSKKSKNKKHQKQSVNYSENTPTKSVSTTVDQPQNVLPKPKSSFIAHLKLISDWHVGSGAGRTGDIDSLVQRDKDGFPYIPAKTLTGIWRDACELVALGLDNGEENGAWQKWVDYLFGEQPALAKTAIETPPRPAALSVRAAYLAENLRQALQHKPELKDALTFAKPGISIEPEYGCAKKDYLRFEEMVRGGTLLKAKCELNLPKDEEQRRTAYALLIAGTQLIERLGGKRRRGSGKCQLVVEENIKPWIDWIASHPQPSEPPDLKEREELTNIEDFLFTQEKTWLQVKLRITTKSPVIVAKRTVGNVVETLDYIPGTHLLRLVRKRFSNFGVDINGAIARGDIVVTNATLEVDEQQGQPVPLSLFYEKLSGGFDKLDKGGKVYNRLVEGEPDGKQLKGYRNGYIGLTNSSHLPKYAKVNLTVETHNTIKDEFQRPTSDIGGVYSYEAIEPGTTLQAELKLSKSLADALSKKSKNKEDWYNCLNGDARLGQSKKDDYGGVSLQVIKPPQPIEKNIEIKDTQLTVWLLSNVLLRDERLRPTTSIEDLAKELGKLLDVKLKTKEQGEKLPLITRTHRVDSWQVCWGLPRPSLVGLAAGSCVVFQVIEGKVETSKLAQIEASGIGERKAEGYGQICFNHPILTEKTSEMQAEQNNKKSPSQTSSGHLISKNDDAFSYARIIEKAAGREAIRRAVLRSAADFDSRKDALGIEPKKPTMSQLGALRSVLGRLQTFTDHIYVMTWLTNLEQTPNRKDKWISDSLQKIRTLVSDQDEIWSQLNIKFADITLTRDGEQYLKEELWAEAVRTLVDACIRAHKRYLEQEVTTQEQGEELHGA